MLKFGFKIAAFFSTRFVIYFLIKTIAMFGQLYIFTTIELRKTIALFGAVSIILSNLLGFLILKEVLPGSVFYFALTNNRENHENPGELNFKDDFKNLMNTEADNIFLVKFSYWIDI